MILVDYSQTVIAAVFANGIHNDMDENLLRHVILNTIRSYNVKYKKKYGDEMVIAVDGGSSWRKMVFPEYKASRAKNREKQKDLIDWSSIFSVMNSVQEELNEFSPFNVIRIESAEADDVIAVLAREASVEKGQPVLIISSDGDMKQLQKYRGVTQYSPLKQAFVEEKDPDKYLKNHVIRGDVGDGVPNIFSDDDTFITEGKRQTPASKKKVEAFMQYLDDGIVTDNKIINETTIRNLHRNKTVIDLRNIPDPLVTGILSLYNNNRSITNVNKKQFLDYLISHKLRSLIESIEDFF